MEVMKTLDGALNTSGERTICPTFIYRPTKEALPDEPVQDASQCNDFSQSPFLVRFQQFRESPFLHSL